MFFHLSNLSVHAWARFMKLGGHFQEIKIFKIRKILNNDFCVNTYAFEVLRLCLGIIGRNLLWKQYSALLQGF